MNARLQVPPRAKRGEEILVRVIVQHPMENGLRRGDDGQLVPYSVIERLTCRYNGAEVFGADLGPGIAANPFFAFRIVADASGEVRVEWETTQGERGGIGAALAVDA